MTQILSHQSTLPHLYSHATFQDTVPAWLNNMLQKEISNSYDPLAQQDKIFWTKHKAYLDEIPAPNSRGQPIRANDHKASTAYKRKHAAKATDSVSLGDSASTSTARTSSSGANRMISGQSSSTTIESQRQTKSNRLGQPKVDCRPKEKHYLSLRQKQQTSTELADPNRTRAFTGPSSDIGSWTLVPRAHHGDDDDGKIPTSPRPEKRVRSNHDASDCRVVEIGASTSENLYGGSNPSVKQLQLSGTVDIPMTRTGFSTARSFNLRDVGAVDRYFPIDGESRHTRFDRDSPCVGSQFDGVIEKGWVMA